MISIITIIYTIGVLWFFLFLQVFALGYVPPNLQFGMIAVPSLMYVVGLHVLYILMQERLMRARRRSHGWASDAVDHTVSVGTLLAFGAAVFLLLTAPARPSALTDLTPIQMIVAAFAPYYAYDLVVNGLLGHQVDHGVARTFGQTAVPQQGAVLTPASANGPLQQVGPSIQLSPAGEQAIVQAMVDAASRGAPAPLIVNQVHAPGR